MRYPAARNQRKAMLGFGHESLLDIILVIGHYIRDVTFGYETPLGGFFCEW